jgi:hypothetical protein
MPACWITFAIRVISDLTLGRDGRIAVTWSDPVTAGEIAAVEGAELRPITRRNVAWLGQLRLATPEPITVRRGGTEIHGLMLKPADWQPGRRYPTIVWIHGGPDSQDAYEFYNIDWQIFAARGYLVLGVNYRGSAGRGEAFSKVIFAEWHPAYGKMIEIDHGNGLVSRYAHTSAMYAKEGDLVVRGQKVAAVGSTGRSTGPHLHFEVRLNGVPQNPARFLQAQAPK